MTDTTLTKAYEQLTPHERFRLTIEAMARGDERDAERLEQICPHYTYRCEDQNYRDRMRRIHLYTMYHALQLSVPRAQMRLVRAFVEVARRFSTPVEKLADAMEKAVGAELYAEEEGFARFCRETLGVERTVVMKALGLGSAEKAVQAGGEDDRAAAKVTEEWVGRWLRRFPEARAAG